MTNPFANEIDLPYRSHVQLRPYTPVQSTIWRKRWTSNTHSVQTIYLTCIGSYVKGINNTASIQFTIINLWWCTVNGTVEFCLCVCGFIHLGAFSIRVHEMGWTLNGDFLWVRSIVSRSRPISFRVKTNRCVLWWAMGDGQEICRKCCSIWSTVFSFVRRSAIVALTIRDGSSHNPNSDINASKHYYNCETKSKIILNLCWTDASHSVPCTTLNKQPPIALGRTEAIK